jgi:hypothetical protein
MAVVTSTKEGLAALMIFGIVASAWPRKVKNMPTASAAQWGLDPNAIPAEAGPVLWKYFMVNSFYQQHLCQGGCQGGKFRSPYRARIPLD